MQNPQLSPTSLRKISCVGRLLALLERHQMPVPAYEIEFLADGDVTRSFQATESAPIWIFHVAAPVGPVDGPRPCQRAIEHRDHVVQDVRICLVEKETLLASRIVVEVQRKTR